MIVHIDSDLNSKTKNLIYDALEFYLQKQLPEEITKDLSIEIEFNSSQYEDGICLVDLNEDESPFQDDPRNFILYLKNKRKNLIEVLAHESVHIKQFALNELKRIAVFDQSDKILAHLDYWNGEIWKPVDDEDIHFDSPWEIAAYGAEYGLAKRYRKYRKMNAKA